jgi:hypothetical protein
MRTLLLCADPIGSLRGGTISSGGYCSNARTQDGTKPHLDRDERQQYVFMVHLSLGSRSGRAAPFPSLDSRGRTITSGSLLGEGTRPSPSGRECRRLQRPLCAAFRADGEGNQQTRRRECSQDRRAQTQSAPDQHNGAEEVDQTQQAARSFSGPEAKGEGGIQGRAKEEVTDRADLLPWLRVLVAGASVTGLKPSAAASGRHRCYG